MSSALPRFPAIVLTVPSGFTFRMQWFPLSATKRSPEDEIAMSAGKRKRAAPPTPSTPPATPGSPARVVTTPESEIFRITWFRASQTKTFPCASRARPMGSLKTAPAPVPSRCPAWPCTPETGEITPSPNTGGAAARIKDITNKRFIILNLREPFFSSSDRRKVAPSRLPPLPG